MRRYGHIFYFMMSLEDSLDMNQRNDHGDTLSDLVHEMRDESDPNILKGILIVFTKMDLARPENTIEVQQNMVNYVKSQLPNVAVEYVSVNNLSKEGIPEAKQKLDALHVIACENLLGGKAKNPKQRGGKEGSQKGGGSVLFRKLSTLFKKKK